MCHLHDKALVQKEIFVLIKKPVKQAILQHNLITTAKITTMHVKKQNIITL